MDEILERLQKTIEILVEEIAKLDDLIEMFPELEVECLIKKDAYEESIEQIEEIIEDFSDTIYG